MRKTRGQFSVTPQDVANKPWPEALRAQFPVEARGDLDLTIQTVDMSVTSRRPDRMRQNAAPRPLEQDMQQNV
ncbi:MAG: hypothetical protein AAFR70_03200, partial [Pseudomonadota bacterium]